MEITKQYLDEGLENLTKHFDGKFEAIDNKIDAQTVELKSYVHEAFEAQQTYMEERFGEIKEALDVRKEVSLLTYDMHRVKVKLGMKNDVTKAR